MNMQGTLRVSALAGAFLIGLSGCGGTISTQSTPATTRASHRVVVAAIGDSETDVRSSIAAGYALGDTVRYVTVTDSGGEHVFSPYALIVRSTDALVVVAYHHAYVFSLKSARVNYANAPVTTASLPTVSLPKIDAHVASGVSAKPSAARRVLCPECTILLGDAGLATKLQGAVDPWQQPAAVDYVPLVIPSSQRAKPELEKPILFSSGSCFESSFSTYCRGPEPPPPPAPNPKPSPSFGSTCPEQFTKVTLSTPAVRNGTVDVLYVVPVGTTAAEVIFAPALPGDTVSLNVTFNLLDGGASFGSASIATPNADGTATVVVAGPPVGLYSSTAGSFRNSTQGYSAELVSSCSKLP